MRNYERIKNDNIDKAKEVFMHYEFYKNKITKLDNFIERQARNSRNPMMAFYNDFLKVWDEKTKVFQTIKKIESILESIPEKHREFAIDWFSGSKTVREMADKYNISVRTVLRRSSTIADKIINENEKIIGEIK